MIGRCLVVAILAASPVPTAADPQPVAVVFEHVSVVAMDAERVSGERTVVVENGRIVAVRAGAASEVPEGALRLDGRGRFLMPGLADMHTHLDERGPGGLDPDHLLAYLAQGVTTVRIMNGRPELLVWRQEIARGERLGPRLVVASPTVYGFESSSSARAGFPEPTTPEEARRMVDRYHEAGYDAIKVYTFLGRELYFAILERARSLGLPVVGHLPIEVGLEEALDRGHRSLEHLHYYLETLETEASKAISAEDFRQVFHAIDYDRSRLRALAIKTREAGVWNTPTMIFFELRLPFEPAREAWNDAELRALGHRNRAEVVRVLHEAGAPLLLGSDSGESKGIVTRGAVLDELELLVEAGLSPFAALAMGTTGPAEYLGRKGAAGIVADGAAADLLLLTCNPLEDIRCMRTRVGVMAGGRWLPTDRGDPETASP